MTGRKNADRAGFDRLADFLIGDVFDTSDDDILAEAGVDGLDPQMEAKRVSDLFEQALLQANKRRLLAAKAALQATHSYTHHASSISDIREARQRLQSLIDQKKSELPVTLAARNESELSDSDVLSMIQDLEELGQLPPGKK